MILMALMEERSVDMLLDVGPWCLPELGDTIHDLFQPSVSVFLLVSQGIQFEERRGGQHQRVPALQSPASPVVVFAFLFCCGSPIAIAFSCVYIRRRLTLHIILVIYKPSSCSIGI